MSITTLFSKRLLPTSLLMIFGVSIVATLILFYGVGEAAITQVNSTTCSNNGTASIACTVTSPANGNTLIAVIGTRATATGTVTSITQTGATWVRATEVANANGVTTEIWYASDISGAGTGVTINLTGTPKASAVIAQYSGVMTSSALDQTAGTTGSGTSASTNTTATTAQADELWVGGLANINTSTLSAPTNSFAIVAQSASTGGATSTRNNTGYLERIVTSTGAATTSATVAATQQWAGAIATFKAAATPTKIAYSTSARTVTAGTCSGAGNIITIQLQDASNNPTNPTGTTVVRVTSDSPSETLYSDSSCSTTITNGDITFTSSENTKSFYIIDTRKSSPTWTLTATKQSGPESLTNGTQSITVNAGTVTRLVTTLPGQTFSDGSGNSGSASNRTAGSSFTITSISATDAYFNVNTSYSGAKTLAYSGPTNAPDSTAPSYTTSVSFTSGQSTTTLTTILYKNESATITVTDAGSYGYASSSVTTNPGSISAHTSDSSVTGNASVAATVALTVTITLKDTWQNPISGVASGNITISGTSSPSLVQPSVNTDANGQTSGTATWASGGSETVSVAIAGVALVQNDGSTSDADGFLDDTHAVTVTGGAATPSSSLQGGTIIQGGTTIQ